MNAPAHVPAELIYEFDYLTDTALLTDPHQRFAELGARFPGGIFYSTANGGHWVLTSYERFCAAARTPEIFSSNKVNIPPTEQPFLLIPINIDPPEHGHYRAAIAPAFAPAKMRTMEPAIEELSRELITAVAPDGHCEFVSAVAEPLPISIFMRWVGLPLERRLEFRDWAVTALTSTEPPVRMENMLKITGFMSEVIEERRQHPGDDIISSLFSAEIDGRPLKTEEIQAYCLLFFLAGLDTVVNAMSFGVRHLATDHDLQARIRNNPDVVPAVVEEALRRYSFVNTARVLTRDYNFDGIQLAEGDMVMLSEAAADLDPNAFENPQEFILDRKGPRHVAFNTGPHACLGAHLARIELTVAYRTLCQTLPAFSLCPDRPAVFTGGSVMGLRELHLIW